MASATLPIAPQRSAPTPYGVTRYCEVDTAALATSTNLLRDDLTPTCEAGLLRVTAQVATGSTLIVRVAKSGRTTKSLTLNGGTALTAGALYAFDIPFGPGVSFNFRVGTQTAFDYVAIQEIAKGGA